MIDLFEYLNHIGNVNFYSKISVNVHCHPKWLPVHQSVRKTLTARKWVEFVVPINVIQNHVLALRLVHKVQAVDPTKDQPVNYSKHIISIFDQIIIVLNQIAFQPQQQLVYTAEMWNAVLMKNVLSTSQQKDKNVFDLKEYRFEHHRMDRIWKLIQIYNFIPNFFNFTLDFNWHKNGAMVLWLLKWQSKTILNTNNNISTQLIFNNDNNKFLLDF